MTTKDGQTTMIPDDIYERAVRAYHRHCDRNGVVRQQPSRDRSHVGADGAVTLANVRGELARYRWDSTRNRLVLGIVELHVPEHRSHLLQPDGTAREYPTPVYLARSPPGIREAREAARRPLPKARKVGRRTTQAT